MTIDEHLDKVAAHYVHATTKHPHFARRVTACPPARTEMMLSTLRYCIRDRMTHGGVDAQTLAECEIAEALDAYTHGQREQAVEECYDAVAVLLRMADMIAAEKEVAK